MIKIYEVIIDKNIKSVEDIVEADFHVLNVLNEEAIPYEKEIQEKETEELGVWHNENYLVISVEEQHVKRVKEIIGEELCMESTILDDIDTIGGKELDASHEEKRKLLDDFHEEEIIENDVEQMNIEECKILFDNIKDKYNKATKINKKLRIIYAVIGIIFTIIIMGYAFLEAMKGNPSIDFTKNMLTLMLIGIAILAVVGVVGGISSIKKSRYEKVAIEKIIKPSLNAFLTDCKFSSEGITRKYFEKSEELPFKCDVFKSENKIIGKINSKKIVAADVDLIPKDKYIFPYSCTFVKSKLGKWHDKKTCVNVSYDYDKDEEEIELEISQNNSIIKNDNVNADFREELLSLSKKHNIEFSLRFEGDVVFLKIHYFSVLPDFKKLFSNDFSEDILLERVNIIKEIIEVANLF